MRTLDSRTSLGPDNAVVISFPSIVKAIKTSDGRRLFEVESSVEQCDLEGDVILQKALIEAGPAFIRKGLIDVDHISELGARMQIPNPESYIVGRPIEVKDIGNKRTSVVGELFRSSDGEHDPSRNRYDAIYDSIKGGVTWYASVYGFPVEDAVEDCRDKSCASGATRFLIKAMDWKSLALTRNPVCDAIKNSAKIITAKAFIELIKSQSHKLPSWVSQSGALDSPPQIASPSEAGSDLPVRESPPAYNGGIANSGQSGAPTTTAVPMPQPRNLADAVGQYHLHGKACPHTGGLNSTPGFRDHFIHCCGMAPDMADLYGHALMHSLLLARRRA